MATCVLLALTLALTPNHWSLTLKIIVFVGLAANTAYAARIYHQSRRNPWTLPEETIAVQVDAKWLRRVKSPIILELIAALSGVSLTFAPALLFLCGQYDSGTVEWIAVPACFLMIYLVPGFFMSLASEVMTQLLKHEQSTANSWYRPRGRP